MERDHSIESEIAATYLDQFNAAQRSELVSLLFSRGGAMQSTQMGYVPSQSFTPTPALVRPGAIEDPPEDGTQQAEAEALTDLETLILDLLKRAPLGDDGLPISYKGDEIAFGIEKSYNYIKELLGPSAPLRARGLITHRRNVGYRISLDLVAG